MSEFMTPDLQIASYLVALGHLPVRIEGTPERRCFVFQGVSEDEVASYYRGTRPLPPQALFTSYRRMKRFLFANPSAGR